MHFIVSLLFTLTLPARAQTPEQETVSPGIHWVKVTWYQPLPGSMEPDKSKLPDIYMHPNQLIEYNKEGRLKSITDFKGGTDDVTLSTTRTFWDGPRPKKKVRPQWRSFKRTRSAGLELIFVSGGPCSGERRLR